MKVHNSCFCNRDLPSEWEAKFKQLSNKEQWSLLSLQDLYNAGNSIQSIQEMIPFRDNQCARSIRCCGQCMRKCYHRCVQDSLNRIYMWRKMIESTPESELSKIPLNLRLVVNQKFYSAQQMSWVVGEILSLSTNTDLRSYMSSAELRPDEHPYKMDYSPQIAIDETTGKRKVNPETGEIQFLEWPKTGLCPFCKPNVTVDRRFGHKGGVY